MAQEDELEVNVFGGNIHNMQVYQGNDDNTENFHKVLGVGILLIDYWTDCHEFLIRQ